MTHSSEKWIFKSFNMMSPREF